MSLLLVCPECRTRMRIQDEVLGKTVRCSRCRVPFAAQALPVELVEDDPPASSSGRPRRNPPDEEWEERRGRPRPPRRRSSVSTVLVVIALVLAGSFVIAATTALVVLIHLDNERRAAARWQEFTPPGGSVSVRLPSTPKETTEAATGRVIHTYSVVQRDRDLGMHLHYFDAPDYERLSPERFNAQIRSNLLKAFPTSTITQESPVSTLDGTAGLEYQFEMPQGARMIRRVYRKGQRVYVVAVSSSRLEASMSDARTFLNSLRLQ